MENTVAANIEIKKDNPQEDIRVLTIQLELIQARCEIISQKAQIVITTLKIEALKKK